MRAGGKGNRESILVGAAGTRLVFDGRLVERITANCTCVSADIPRPHGHGVPFYNCHVKERRGERKKGQSRLELEDDEG